MVKGQNFLGQNLVSIENTRTTLGETDNDNSDYMNTGRVSFFCQTSLKRQTEKGTKVWQESCYSPKQGLQVIKH